MEQTIIYLDASSLQTMHCARKHQLTCLEGWQSKTQSTLSMDFGSRMHSFRHKMLTEAWEPGSFKSIKTMAEEVHAWNPNLTVERKDKRYLTKGFLMSTFVAYERYVWDEKPFQVLRIANGKPASELTFAFTFYETAELKVVICGTIDSICKTPQGPIICDMKTTAMCRNPWDYFAGYECHTQMLFYIVMLRDFCKKHPELKELGKIARKIQGAQIDGVFLNAKAPFFRMSSVFEFSTEQLNEYREMVYVKIWDLINKFETKKFARLREPEGIMNHTCESVYGKCQFYNFCCKPIVGETLTLQSIESDPSYERKIYEPLKFGK